MFELIPFDHRIHSIPLLTPSVILRIWSAASLTAPVLSLASVLMSTDTGDAYKLEAELPGFNKDDIKIDIGTIA